MNITIRKQLALPEKDRRTRLIQQETHAGLWLDKYIENPAQEETASRKALLEEVTAIPLSSAYHDYYHSWVLALQGYQAQQRCARARGRLIIGMGDENVLETGIALHHTYGVPYLPGSALKGLAASYAHQQLQQEEWRKGGAWHTVVFGKNDEAGFITFFDALYIPKLNGEQKLVLYQDVIAVHHPDYYRNTNVIPADWDSPTPITFLSATGTYLLALAAPDLEENERALWIQATFQILELALANRGIGAKTSSGYGRMRVIPTAFPGKETAAEQELCQEIQKSLEVRAQ